MLDFIMLLSIAGLDLIQVSSYPLFLNQAGLTFTLTGVVVLHFKRKEATFNLLAHK